MKRDSQERDIRLWDSSASAYDRFERRWHYYERVGERLVRALPLRPDSEVLELACGTGACTARLAEGVPLGHVLAVDQSSQMLGFARRNTGHVGRRLSFLQGDAGKVLRALRKRRRAFDFVVCNSAFWQLSDVGNLLGDVRGVASSRGLLGFNLPFWFRSKGEYLRYRKTINGVLLKYGVDSREFWSRRRPVDYPKLLADSSFRVVKDTRYYIAMDEVERLEWRRIPAFRRRWGAFRGLPRKVALEVRKELETESRPWPENRDLRSKWRLILAEAL